MPAPRFGSTPAAPPRPAERAGAQTRAILAEVGLDDAAVDELITAGAVSE
jgi:alpha-methylacyl-CoA racemase